MFQLALVERAIGLHDVPEKIAIEKKGANTAAIVSMQADSGLGVAMRQLKYLSHIVEQNLSRHSTGHTAHARIQKL